DRTVTGVQTCALPISARAGVRRLQERQPIAQASVADSGVLQDHKSGSGHTKVGIASAGQESQKLFSVRWTREYAESLQSAGPDQIGRASCREGGERWS